MGNHYYSIRVYVDEQPLSINCQDLLEMADDISELLGCKYDCLGYVLLDPDYDYKDLGIMMKNTEKNREKFLKLSIPTVLYSKEEDDISSPSVSFMVKGKDNIELPIYVIQFEYPTNNTQYLCIEIDVKEDLLLRELTLTDFYKVQEIISSKGYAISSSFLDYYTGDSKRMNFDGGEDGITTVNDWRIIDHAIRFRQDWKDKIMDVFYMNGFNKSLLTKAALDKVIKIVGDENVIDCGEKIIFKLPQSKSSYLLNRIMSMKSRRAIKNILQDENVCFQDESIIASILKL